MLLYLYFYLHLYFFLAENQTFYPVKNVLSKLEALLEPLDVLQCDDVVLPKTQNEWKDLQALLAKCSNTLKDITSLIGSKDETYCTINTELKNFTKTYNEIENLQKKCVTKNFDFFSEFSFIIYI